MKVCYVWLPPFLCFLLYSATYICRKCYRKNRPVRKTDWPPSRQYYNCLSSCTLSSAEPLVCVKWPCTLIQRVSLFDSAVQNSEFQQLHTSIPTIPLSLYSSASSPLFFSQLRAKQARRGKKMKRCFRVGNQNRPSREGNIQYDGEKWRRYGHKQKLTYITQNWKRVFFGQLNLFCIYLLMSFSSQLQLFGHPTSVAPVLCAKKKKFSAQPCFASWHRSNPSSNQSSPLFWTHSPALLSVFPVCSSSVSLFFPHCLTVSLFGRRAHTHTHIRRDTHTHTHQTLIYTESDLMKN